MLFYPTVYCAVRTVAVKSNGLSKTIIHVAHLCTKMKQRISREERGFSHFWIIKDMLGLYLERYNDTGISQHAKLGREQKIIISAHKHESLS